MSLIKNNKKMLKLNLGCGLNAPQEWLNIDASFTARLSKVKWLYKLTCKIFKIEEISWPKNIKIIDIRKGLPFKNGSVKNIFSSHILEHISYRDADFVIKECFRVLCKDGVMRIIVPDLYQITKRYVQLVDSNPQGEYSYNFVKDLNAFDDNPPKGVMRSFKQIFSHGKHLYMYDQWSLKELLEKHGFKNVQRMNYGQSQIPDIAAVEEQGRHESAVCLEGIKQ